MNLYFRSSNFNSNKALAKYIFNELASLGLNPAEPQNEDFMYIIEATIENEKVIFYMGRNDELSDPPLWQIWPEQKVPLFKRIFGKVNNSPETAAKALIEKIVGNISGVADVEWGV